MTYTPCEEPETARSPIGESMHPARHQVVDKLMYSSARPRTTITV